MKPAFLPNVTNSPPSLAEVPAAGPKLSVLPPTVPHSPTSSCWLTEGIRMPFSWAPCWLRTSSLISCERSLVGPQVPGTWAPQGPSVTPALPQGKLSGLQGPSRPSSLSLVWLKGKAWEKAQGITWLQPGASEPSLSTLA